jgi:hypothetical protein
VGQTSRRDANTLRKANKDKVAAITANMGS